MTRSNSPVSCNRKVKTSVKHQLPDVNGKRVHFWEIAVNGSQNLQQQKKMCVQYIFAQIIFQELNPDFDQTLYQQWICKINTPMLWDLFIDQKWKVDTLCSRGSIVSLPLRSLPFILQNWIKTMYNTEGYSRCFELLEFGNGLGLLAGHEPINEEAGNQGEEKEVQVAEKRLLLTHHGLAVGGGLSIHLGRVGTLHGNRMNTTIRPVYHAK